MKRGEEKKKKKKKSRLARENKIYKENENEKLSNCKGLMLQIEHLTMSWLGTGVGWGRGGGGRVCH